MTWIARAWPRVTLALALVVASPRAIAQPATSPAVAPVAPAPSEAPPQPATAALATPPPVASNGSSDRQWLKDVYEKAADSVVLIETEHGRGSGFFYVSNRYVATALHVVDDAEVIVVSMSNGQRTYGSVVAYSRNHDVALVELVHPFPDARVLAPYRGPVAIGETVAVIGHPFSGLEKSLPRLRGLLNWSLTEGVVGAVAGSWIQTDAAINPGNSGGPVLNERGEVLGVVSAKLTDAQGIGMIARIKRVDELVPKIGQMSPPRQRVAFDGIDFGFVINWLGDESIDGFAIGSGVRVVKRYPIRFRLGFLGGTIEPSAPTVLESRLQRFSNELTFGYALPLGDYLELSPYLGVAFFYDWRKDSSLQIDGNLACPSPPCLVEGRVLRSTDFDFRILPMIGATLDLGHLSASYAYELDFSDIDASEHRVFAGLKF